MAVGLADDLARQVLEDRAVGSAVALAMLGQVHQRAAHGLRPTPARAAAEMLVLVGGRERTRAEYTDLLARAGFELTAIHANPGRDLILASPV